MPHYFLKYTVIKSTFINIVFYQATVESLAFEAFRITFPEAFPGTVTKAFPKPYSDTVTKQVPKTFLKTFPKIFSEVFPETFPKVFPEECLEAVCMTFLKAFREGIPR